MAVSSSGKGDVRHSSTRACNGTPCGIDGSTGTFSSRMAGGGGCEDFAPAPPADGMRGVGTSVLVRVGCVSWLLFAPGMKRVSCVELATENSSQLGVRAPHLFSTVSID